jgi:hypothetical protein
VPEASEKAVAHLSKILFVFSLAFVVTPLRAQDDNQSQTDSKSDKTEFGESKRIFGIVPNYRTSPLPNPFVPLSAKQKFVIATQDSFDRGTVLLAAAFAGEGQLTNSNKAFGQGAAGYGQYFGTALADFVIGNYMTEAIFPSMLHQDPRYFTKSKGSGMSRLGYAVGQIFFTHGDNGKTEFNFSEIIGNSTAVAISQSYYVDNRDAKDAGLKLVSQLGVDAAANVLKEFWPDVKRKFQRHHANN